MRYIYEYPEVSGPEPDMLDCGPASELAIAAEQAGWHGFAFSEHPVPGARWMEQGGHQTLDPFIALGHVAAVTTRIRLVTYLAVVPYRNPFLLAKATATVDKLSGGRMVLGAGTGYHKAEFYALGIDFEERNALFDEALDVLPLHWKGEPFSYKGLHFEARNVIARPRPVQDPIPIWIGGNAQRTLRRVAERAQGWMPLRGSAQMSATTRTPQIASNEDLAARIAQLRELAGDRADQIDIIAAYSDPSIIDPGTETDRHLEAIAEFERIGVTHLRLAPVTRPASATLEFVEAFGKAFITQAG